MVSVIIPVYNRERTIVRSVRSVLGQSITDFEVIVVDDCSEDALEKELKAINDERLRYIRLNQRSGACVARNRGVAEAAGEYIAFQDSDDEWFPDKLEKQMKALEENGADICFCMLRRHYVSESNNNDNNTEDSKSGRVVLWPETAPKSNTFMDHVTLRRKSYASTQTIIAKREVFDEALFDPGVIKSQDYDWMIRASRNHCVYFLAEALVEQYLQPDSISMGGYSKFVDSRLYLIKKYEDICREDREFKIHLLRQLAHYKSLAGMDASKEYSELFSMEKSFHNLLCILLSRIGLMKKIRAHR